MPDGEEVDGARFHEILEQSSDDVKALFNMIFQLVPDLQALGVQPFIACIPMRNGMYFTGEESYAQFDEVHSDGFYNMHMIFCVRMTEDTQFGYVRCNHALKTMDMRAQVLDLLRRHMDGHFVWNGSGKDCIKITYEQQQEMDNIRLRLNEFPSLTIVMNYQGYQDEWPVPEELPLYEQVMGFLEGTGGEYGLDSCSGYEFEIRSYALEGDFDQILDQLKAMLKAAVDAGDYQSYNMYWHRNAGDQEEYVSYPERDAADLGDDESDSDEPDEEPVAAD